MKRILFIIADLCSRGAEHQIVTVACLLKREGYDVSFVCYHENNFYEYILKNNNIPVIWIKLQNCIKRLFFIRKFIRDGKYDVVISFLSADNFLNDFAALGGHKWKVITGERSSKISLLLSLKGKIFGMFQRYTDFIVCNSENALKMWKSYYPEYSDKLHVIYNNVQLTPINSKYSIRKNSKTNIIIAGAYSYVKDPMSMIYAISIMSLEERNKLCIDWYGKIDSNSEAQNIYKVCCELIKFFKLQNIIFLHEATKDILSKMNEADVVALFSHWEGLPNSICEGMAIGKPILMTNISDYDVLVDERNGWLCNSGYPESIYQAIKSIIQTTDSTLIQMGRESKRKADMLFSDKKILSEWLELIN